MEVGREVSHGHVARDGKFVGGARIPGAHRACDVASCSEIVVPLDNDRLVFEALATSYVERSDRV